jgi:zinc protease
LLFLTRDRVKAVSLADVQRVAQQYLVQSNRTVGTYLPTAAPVRAPAPQHVDVAAMLNGFKGQAAGAQAETFLASPANINARTQRLNIEPGLKVALLPKTTRGQAVRATLTLRMGDEKSLANWGEVPSALGALLDKGSATLSRQQVQDRMDALQAEIGFQADDGTLSVGIATKRENLPAAIELVGDLLRHPSLPADALEEVRRQALTGLEGQRKEPQAVLNEALSRHGNPYPKGDVRYARTFDEMDADWRAVRIEQVRDFHARFVGASQAQFAAVGDFDPKAVTQALQRALGGWVSQQAIARVPSPLVLAPSTRIQISTPDKQNAAMQVLQDLPLNDSHPDYPAFMLANHLLGSGGDSRFWNRIREKEGLSYSVYSAVQWNSIEENSQWIASAIFAPQNRAKVEAAFREEVSKVLAQGFTQTEFEAGKRGLLNFRQLSRAQDARLAGAWVGNLYLDRTFEASAKVDAALEALSLDQVNQALRRYLKPDQFVFGLAGDFKDTAK